MSNHKYDILMPGLTSSGILKAGGIHRISSADSRDNGLLARIVARQASKRGSGKRVFIADPCALWPSRGPYDIDITFESSIDALEAKLLSTLNKSNISLVIINDFQVLRSYRPGSDPLNMARTYAKFITNIKSAQKKYNIPVVITTQKKSFVPYPSPNGMTSTYLLDNFIELMADKEDSWELVDEDGGRIGHRVQVTVNGEHVEPFWMDRESCKIYHMWELDRKLFDD